LIAERTLSRRALLATPLGMALARCADAAGVVRLKDLAARAGLRFGTDSDVTITAAPAAYAALLPEQADLFAPNLGWRRVAGALGAPEPAWEDPNVAFAREHGMPLTGAHLLWYQSLPAWFATLEPEAARRAAGSHITQMLGHYRGRVYNWNVVNEEIDTRGGDADGMRRSVLAEKLGPSFIADAFKAAAAARPDALLTYNDSHFEMDTPFDAARRSALLRLLDRLQRAGAPIGAVGLQSHLRIGSGRFDPALYRRFLHDIAARGLKILITELDVSDVAVSGSIAQRDQAVASFYSAFLNTALDEPAVAQVVIWGLSDRYTWLTAATDPSNRRADGEPNRPLPFDDAFQPKPAFAAIAAALRAAPVRHLA
jgi:endo-1,4-beta-xylanase